MQIREKLLIGGFVAAFAVWQGSGFVYDAVWGAVVEQRGALEKLQVSVRKKDDQAIELSRQLKQLSEWRLASLPPDAGKSARPDALNAQRLYLDWLTELAHASGLKNLKITPERRSSKQGLYIGVAVSIDATGNYQDVAGFLAKWQAAPLLQRMNRLQITADSAIPNPPVKVSLEAEGVVIPTAAPRSTIVPTTTLAAALPADAPAVAPALLTGFPTAAGFQVRIDEEVVAVTAVVTAGGKKEWKVTRGAAGTKAAAHEAGAEASLVSLPNSPAANAILQDLLAKNPFAKPVPPRKYQMELSPTAEQIVLRGKPWQLKLDVKNFDPSLGTPLVATDGYVPDGLTLAADGRELKWTPPEELPAGEYPLTLVVRQPGTETPEKRQTLKLVLREPNNPPKWGTLASETVYIGRPWKATFKATDPDPAQRLQYKVDGAPPPGFTLNESTGEASWSPTEGTAPGPQVVKIVATDNGTPAASATATLTLQVADDAAAFTHLVGIIAQGEHREAWLYDRLGDRRTVLGEGGEIRSADLRLRIDRIEPSRIVVSQGDRSSELYLGQPLRELQVLPQQAAPAPASALAPLNQPSPATQASVMPRG